MAYWVRFVKHILAYRARFPLCVSDFERWKKGVSAGADRAKLNRPPNGPPLRTASGDAGIVGADFEPKAVALAVKAGAAAVKSNKHVSKRPARPPEADIRRLGCDVG